MRIPQKLRLTLDRDFYQFGKRDSDQNIRNFNISTEVIDSSVLDEELIFPLADERVIFNKKRRKGIKEHTVVDLSPYRRSQIPFR
jgi:hypothetical protein